MIADAEAQALKDGLKDQLQRVWDAQDAHFARLGQGRHRAEDVAAALRIVNHRGTAALLVDVTRELVENGYTLEELRAGFRLWVNG